MRLRPILLSCLLTTPLLAAEPAPTRFEWSGPDTGGTVLKSPAEKPTVLVFVMADQPQSKLALEQARAVLKTGNSGPAVQVAAVFSGKPAAASAKALAEAGAWPFPVVADPDYAASGKAGVHVWPTTVVVSAKGDILAHLAGLPRTFRRDLEAHVQFALGKLDAAGLRQRLDAHDVIADTPAQSAHRHLLAAQRLMDKGLWEQARAELETGLKQYRNDPQLQLALVRVLLALGQAGPALDTLGRLDGKALPPRQLQILRGRALVALRKWDEALPLLQEAVRLNPDPAEGYYELGLIHQHQGKWEEAAKAFRAAFEATPTGRQATTLPAKGSAGAQ